MSLDTEVLRMATEQATAIRDNKPLPYKPPYVYQRKDETGQLTKHEIDQEWFDSFTKNFFGHKQIENELPKIN